MKNNFKAMLLSVLMLISLLLFASCEKSSKLDGGDGTDATLSAEAAYKVTVQDALGNPYADGVAVKFMQNGQQVAMQIPNASGVAEKTLARGNYTVELHFTTEAAYHYDTSALTLTAEQTELSVILSKTLDQKTMALYADGADQTAYYVSPGCTHVTLNKESRSYFILDIQTAGTYEFSLVGSNAAIGYYGESHYIQSDSLVEVTDNRFQMSYSEDKLGGIPVIGIDAAEGDAILCIERIGEAGWSIEMEEWTVYEPSVTLAPYTVPAGATLNKFDITADGYTLVFNENDGFYHLDSADGPLVVVWLAKTQQQPEYLDTFEQILENYALRRIFYTEDGEFIKKEGYGACLKQYIENCDETYGVYPLTKDLCYIIEQAGIQQGWFDPSSHGYLFCDSEGVALPDINNDISWLFMCRYL